MKTSLNKHNCSRIRYFAVQLICEHGNTCTYLFQNCNDQGRLSHVQYWSLGDSREFQNIALSLSPHTHLWSTLWTYQSLSDERCSSCQGQYCGTICLNVRWIACVIQETRNNEHIGFIAILYWWIPHIHKRANMGFNLRSFPL